MNTGLKITAFAAALAATFGTAYGVGSAVDPVVAETEPAERAGHAKEKDGAGAHEGHDESGGGETPLPGGLQIADQGFALDLKTPRVEAGKASELRFAIVDQNAGRNVTEFRREHGKELHLIVASRDLTTYRHLHPVRAADGIWSTRVELPKAGGYRVFADFAPEAKNSGLTLGADLAVSGASNPQPLPRPERKATVDGYEVTLKGDLRPGVGSELKLSVAKDGRGVTDLQPYLGAYGHLVALRSGDLAYLHVHPNGEPGDGRTKPGPEISFTATAPSKGSYRLFLDFQHEGKVRTAAFTVQTGVPAAQQSEPEEHESSGHQH